MQKFNTPLACCCALFAVMISSAEAAAATASEIEIDANDAVYDSSRNLIYASVASSAGAPNGNSIVTIDPSNLRIVARRNAGSEPTRLAISADDSRVYVGIDGARAFRYFTPDSGALGPLVPLLSGVGIPQPAVAEDFAVSPDDPAVVVVSIDKVGSTADGELGVFDDSGLIGGANLTFPDGNSLAFTASDTLVGFNNTSTGYYVRRWNFDGANLFIENEVRGLIQGTRVEIEAEGGLIYSTNGAVIDPTDLTRLGTFPAGGAVESFAAPGLTFFLEDGILQVFDNASFLLCDSIDIGQFGMDAIELFDAGDERLGYVTASGSVGIIQGVPLQGDCSATSSVPDVKVNGSDVLVNAGSGETINLSLSLDAGSQAGELADWSIGVMYAGGFLPAFSGQSALVDLAETTVFQAPLPPGLYFWLFAFDLNPDGVQEYTYFDWVPIAVSGSGAAAIPGAEAGAGR